MENEGIMSLPEGQAMQNQGPTNQPIYVSSADTYDAALTALGASSNDPAQIEAVKQAVRESIDELDLSPTEVDSLLEVLEYMSQNPSEYPQIRQRLIEMGMMDDDDLPEAYDPAYLGMAIMALNEYRAAGVQGAQAPMEMAPVVEGLEPMAMAEGGLADMAKYLASRGRNGDTMLAHITPSEARLLKSMGGSGTINPETGLPEFFLKKIFKKVKKAVKKILKNPIVRIIATVALATVLGPAAAAAAGKVGIAMSTAATTAAGATLSSAAVSAMAGEKLNAKSLLINAATSYFGAGGTIGGINPVGKVAELASRIPGVTPGGAVAQGIGAGVTSAGIGKLAGMGTEEALGMGLQSGIMTGIQTARANAAAAKATQSPEMRGDMSQFSSQGQQAPPAPVTGEVALGGEQGAAFSPEGGAAYRTPTTGGTPESLIVRQTGQQYFPEGAAPQGPAAPASSAVPYRSSAYGINAPGSITPTAAATPSTGMPTTAAPTGVAPADTFFGRVGQFFEKPSTSTFTDAFLVNPKATTALGKYAPGVATALAVTGATGGFKAGKAEENPLFDRDYTGADYIRDNPELFKNRVQPTKLEPYNPVVETPSYGLGQPSAGSTSTGPSTISTLPISPTPTYMPPPGAVTNMPGGVPQPYNVSGLYGVPLLYGNPVQPTSRPPGYARGGAVDNAVRAATSNPVNVAQTEAMLFAGPQAAQQAGMAVQALDRGGIMGVQGLRKGGQPTKFPRKTGPINGPGTGTSDSIPAMLSDGEFVFTAKAVRNAGQGSRRKGARRMYKLMKMLEGGNVKGN
jgi:hypothetical protein